MGLLDEKTAIVTGAGRGIGRDEARYLASQGASVVVNDVDGDEASVVVKEIAADGGVALVNTDDVSTWDGARSVVEAANHEYGELAIVVNNAGILRDAMSFSMSEEQWDDVIRVHLKGHAALAHFAGSYWRERAKAGEPVEGRLINTASESGLYGLAGQVNYAAAKAGIASMTIVLARELKKYGVTVNAIAPRARTRMTETVLGGIGPDEGGFDEWDPANIAPVVGWLASDEAADVTGQVFVVFANRLHVMAGWHLAGTIDTSTAGNDGGADEGDRALEGGRLTPTFIAAHRADLFGDRSPGLPPMGFGH